MRMLQRIAHSRLRSEMHDRAEISLAENRLGRLAFGKIDLMKTKLRKLPQHREPRFLERRVVIIVDAIDANHSAAVFQKPPRQRKADETCATRDQNRLWRA